MDFKKQDDTLNSSVTIHGDLGSKQGQKKMPKVYIIITMLYIIVLGILGFVLINLKNDDSVVSDGVLEIDSVSLRLDVNTTDEAELYLILADEINLSGLELFFAKDSELKLKDFNCEVPFKCIEFQSDGDITFLLSVVPPDFTDSLSGELLLGHFIYEGSGSMSLDVDRSFLGIVDDLSLTIDYGEFIF